MDYHVKLYEWIDLKNERQSPRLTRILSELFETWEWHIIFDEGNIFSADSDRCYLRAGRPSLHCNSIMKTCVIKLKLQSLDEYSTHCKHAWKGGGVTNLVMRKLLIIFDLPVYFKLKSVLVILYFLN